MFILQILSLIFIILILVQGVGGTISNALSLSYFLKKDRATLASKLMILLNSIDLLVCISALVYIAAIAVTFFSNVFGDGYVMVYLLHWFYFLVTATAFATCLLSVTRTISLVSPFYEIRKKALAFSIIIYGMNLVFSRFVLPLLNFKVANIYMIVEMSLIILIVIISLIISVVKLQSGGNNLANSATITIIIISGFFCAVNIAYLASMIINTFKSAIWNNQPPRSVSFAFEYATFVGIPFNSTINPIIYFIRKKQIRDYVKSTCIGGCCYRCCCCCCKVCCGKRKNTTKRLDRAKTQVVHLSLQD